MTTPPTTGVDVMQEVLQALGACEGGQSVDLDALRQRVQGVAADIWDLEKRLPDVDDKYAVFWVATVTQSLVPAVDCLKVSDFDGARLAIRDAWHAPAGQRAPRPGTGHSEGR